MYNMRMYNVRCSCCENVGFMIHRYLWFETEVTARRDAPPIKRSMHRSIFLPLMELMRCQTEI